MVNPALLFDLLQLHLNLSISFDILNNQIINEFINKYGYNIPRYSIIFLGILSLSLLLIYKFSSLKQDFKHSYYLKYREDESINKEYHLYFLFLGIAIITSELVFEIFSFREKKVLIANITVGSTIILFYYILSKIPYLFKKIRYFFIVFFIFYFIYISSNVIRLSDNIFAAIGFLIFIFFSYNVIKPIKLYYVFISGAILFLFIILSLDSIPVKNAIILINYSIVIFVINQIRHIIFLNVKDKLQFANEIVQKGNSLIIACNIRGECMYCSDSIEAILGYSADEVMGMEYWRLTQDSEFRGQKYYENHDENALYTRKLKCKNGDYKYIQWKDKRLEEDLIIGIGQDITEQHIQKNQFINLIQTASDIIFEIDTDGCFTFVNNYALKILGYTEKQIIGQHYNQFVHSDFQENTINFYENLEVVSDDFPVIEIPLTKRNGEKIWVSQKVITKKNEHGELSGYSGIARDITDQRNQENLKSAQLIKLNGYNEIVQRLSTTNFSTFKNTAQVINYILKESTGNNDIISSSFWVYKPDQIKCKFGYSKVESFAKEKKGLLTRVDFPVYFEAIENKSQIIISDVLSKYETSEFDHEYLDESGVKSLIDSAVYVNGKLNGIVCFESQIEKKWDSDDSNFAKTIADIMSLGIATQLRMKEEKNFKEKSQLLSAVAKCTDSFLKNKSLYEMFEETFEAIGKASKSDRMSYYEKNELDGLFDQKFYWVKDKGTDSLQSEKRFSEEECSEIIAHINNQAFFEIETENLKESTLKNWYLEKNVKSVVLLPIYVGNQLTGALGLGYCKVRKKLSKDQMLILITLTNNISTFLENKRKEKIILESEQRFKLIVKTVPGVVYLSKYDKEATKIYLNDEIEKLTGYPKEDFLESKISFLSLIHPDYKDTIVKEQLQNLENKKSIHSKYPIKRKSGEYIWIEEYADIIFNGSVIEYIGGIYFLVADK